MLIDISIVSDNDTERLNFHLKMFWGNTIIGNIQTLCNVAREIAIDIEFVDARVERIETGFTIAQGRFYPSIDARQKGYYKAKLL